MESHQDDYGSCSTAYAISALQCGEGMKPGVSIPGEEHKSMHFEGVWEAACSIRDSVIRLSLFPETEPPDFIPVARSGLSIFQLFNIVTLNLRDAWNSTTIYCGEQEGHHPVIKCASGFSSARKPGNWGSEEEEVSALSHLDQAGCCLNTPIPNAG